MPGIIFTRVFYRQKDRRLFFLKAVSVLLLVCFLLPGRCHFAAHPERPPVHLVLVTLSEP